eukprot:8697651-Pyramimonas_sp.AAC.1
MPTDFGSTRQARFAVQGAQLGSTSVRSSWDKSVGVVELWFVLHFRAGWQPVSRRRQQYSKNDAKDVNNMFLLEVVWRRTAQPGRSRKQRPRAVLTGLPSPIPIS